ncbi:hypothetical protein D3C81_1161440 [compost metagenome]
MASRACLQSGWLKLPGRNTFVIWLADYLSLRLRVMSWMSLLTTGSENYCIWVAYSLVEALRLVTICALRPIDQMD